MAEYRWFEVGNGNLGEVSNCGGWRVANVKEKGGKRDRSDQVFLIKSQGIILFYIHLKLYMIDVSACIYTYVNKGILLGLKMFPARTRDEPNHQYQA